MRPRGDWTEEGRGGTKIALPTSPPLVDLELDTHQGGTGSEDGESDLGDLPELKAEVASFLQGSSEMSCDEDPPLEPPMSRPTD